MIYPLASLIFGAILGAIRARQRGGKTADLVQWSLVFAMIFGILGLFAMILIDRSYQ